jgi:putative spermidine/putrescine transport system permease protein
MTASYQKKNYALSFATWSILFFIAAPVLVNIPVSLTDKPYLSFPTDGISFAHYQKLVSDASWLQTGLNSFIVAICTSLLATLIGTLCAFSCWQIQNRNWAKALAAVVLFPLVVPSVVSALGFRRILVQTGLYDTFVGITIVHIIVAIPYAFICVSASLRLFDHKYLHAARSLGASQMQAMRWILFPSVMPGMLAGAVLSFINSWDEVVVLLFISARNVVLLPRKMLQGIQDDIDPSLAAASSVFVAVTTIGVILSMVYRARNDARADSFGPMAR